MATGAGRVGGSKVAERLSGATESSSLTSGSSFDDGQPLKVRALAEDVADAHIGESGKRRLRPEIRVGAARGSGDDRHRGTGLEGAQDRGDQFDGGFTDQSELGDLVVQQPFGDVLRPGVDLRPRMVDPRAVVEHDQVVLTTG